MPSPDNKYRDIIVQGWTGMLFLLCLMLLTDIVGFGMKGDFSPLVQDPGNGGLWFIVIAASVNVLIQMSVRTFEHRTFRRAICVMTPLYTLIFIGHHAEHFMTGEGFDAHLPLDIAHHILGIWASVAAFRWAASK